MQGTRSLSQYRAIDCSLFAIMLIVFETVINRAATAWFPKEAWTVSVVPAVTAIVMVRWGPWCALHAAIGGIVTVLALRGNGIQFLIYGIGNLAAMAVWPLLKKRGWEALHGNVLLNIAFGALTVLAGADRPDHGDAGGRIIALRDGGLSDLHFHDCDPLDRRPAGRHS